MTQIADSLTWVKGRHTLKMGADLRWERLNVVQPPSPTGSFTFSNLFTDLPRRRPNTGTPLASFLLGQVQQFSIDLQQEEIRNRAHFQEYFIQDDWRLSDRVTVNAGLRYTLNFPVDRREQPGRGLQSGDRGSSSILGATASPAPRGELHKLNFGPRLGIVGRITDKTVVRTGYGLVWIEMAGITTPFTTPVFPFLQTVSQRTLDNITPAFTLAHGPTSQPIPLTPDAGLGQGVFSVDRDLGSGYVQQWNTSLQRELTSNISVEVAYVGFEDHARRSSRHEPESADRRSARARARRCSSACRTRTSASSRARRRSAIRRFTVAQLLKPYPQYTTVSLYRNNVGTTIYHGFYTKLEQRFSRGLSYLVSYTRSKLMDDASSVFDASILTGPVANFPVADSFNRRLERDYSTGDIPHVFVASAVWDIPFGANRRSRASGVLGALVNDWTRDGRAHAAVGHPDRHHADDQQQRVRRVRHAAAQPDRRSRRCLPTSDRSADGSTRARSRRRRRSRLARARAIRSAGPAIAISTSH